MITQTGFAYSNKGRSITIILPSEASMSKNEDFGLLPRWKRLFDEYKKYFEKIEVYTCDKENFTEKIGVQHYPCKMLVNVKYVKAISYNFWILFKIPQIKSNIIRFFGSVYPLMPLYRLFNKTPKILSYQYDFYKKTLLDFGFVRGSIGYLAERYSVKYIGNIITTTYELQEILQHRYRLKSFVNPNFVDLDTFFPDEEEGDYLFFAGRIFYTKGIDLLIEMIKKFKADGRYVKLLLAGKGDVEKYTQIVKDEKLDDRIIFLGGLPSAEVAGYMSRCKIFVFPTTTQEGHPKSLIEAQAAGAPCVVSRVLGNTEVVQDGVNGLIVEPGDLNGLIEKTDFLLKNDEARLALKKAAVQSAQKFDIKTVVKNEVQLLLTIIENHGKKS